MTATAARYMGWLQSTAEQAKRTAMAARTAAAAYEHACAMRVAVSSAYYMEALPAGVIGAENNLGVLPNLGAAGRLSPLRPRSPRGSPRR